MSEYTLLFNGITDALSKLEQLRLFLMELQKQAETLYIERAD